jgi:hypothetical protein
MTNTLLDRFLEIEATDFVINLLRQALRDHMPQIRHFDFNTHEVTIDHEQGTVLIEDVLDGTGAGTLLVPIAGFITALDKKAGSLQS